MKKTFPPRFLNWFVAAMLVLTTLSAYWSASSCGFVKFDDPEYVSSNRWVVQGFGWPGFVWAFSHFYLCNWHPLTWLSHMLVVQWFALNPAAHHVVNVLFHAANTVLIFLWLRRLTGLVWRSAFVAALFGLHPMHVESVAWISERKDVLSAFFMLLSLMAYTGHARKSAGENNPTRSRLFSASYWFSLGFFALGLMSKPMIVTLPFVLLLLDYWPLNRIPHSALRIPHLKRLLLEKIPFFALSAASCVVTFLAQQIGKAVMSTTVMPVGARMENAVIAYWGYLQKIFWPSGLAACYPLSLPIDVDQTIIAATLLLFISILVFRFRRQQPWLVMGWLWFLGTLMPVIGLVQVGSQSMADRYSYIPSMGVFIAIVWFLAGIKPTWPHLRLVYVPLAITVLGACWVLTAVQVSYWQSSETLARHALSVTTNNATMENLLGLALFERGEKEEALRHAEAGVRIWPNDVDALHNLALILDSLGRFDEAIDTCQTALVLHSGYAKIHYILAHALSHRGRLAEAIREYKSTIQIEPENHFAMNDLSWLLATTADAGLRDGAEAVRLASRACELTRYQQTLYIGTLAAAYAEAGDFKRAIATAQQACKVAEKNGETNLFKRNQELIGLYLAHKAVRE